MPFSSFFQPIIPDTFTLVPRQVRTEKGYKPDNGVVSQIKVIKKLFDASEQIIVATDAGREGELIFRYLYHYTGSTTPVSYTHLDVYKRQVRGRQDIPRPAL